MRYMIVATYESASPFNAGEVEANSMPEALAAAKKAFDKRPATIETTLTSTMLIVTNKGGRKAIVKAELIQPLDATLSRS